MVGFQGSPSSCGFLVLAPEGEGLEQLCSRGGTGTGLGAKDTVRGQGWPKGQGSPWDIEQTRTLAGQFPGRGYREGNSETRVGD